MLDNYQEWLNTPPLEEELRKKDDALYIPYHIIVDKLNTLCENNWSTKNCIHLFYTLKNGKTIVSCTIDVVIKIFEITGVPHTERTLSGAATFSLSKNSNPHPAASVKSLAIMNAVKPLGKQFGWGLNGFESESVDMNEVNSDDTTELSSVEKNWINIIENCKTPEELITYELMIEKNKSVTDTVKDRYKLRLKELLTPQA